MDSVVSRRRYVTFLGVSAAVGLAGCSDSSDDVETGGGDEDTETGQQGPDDDTATGDDGGSDGSDTGGEDDDSGGEVEDTEDDDTEEQTDNLRLRDVFNWEDSYIMEMTSTEGSGRTVVYQGDSHSTWSTDSEEFESYQIGGDSYSVFDGQCYQFSSEPVDEEFDPEEPAEGDVEYYATGTTTISGQEVYEFDLGEGLYYLSVSTGYPVRYVGDEGAVVDFHSWGETSPISPPEMDCIEA